MKIWMEGTKENMKLEVFNVEKSRIALENDLKDICQEIGVEVQVTSMFKFDEKMVVNFFVLDEKMSNEKWRELACDNYELFESIVDDWTVDEETLDFLNNHGEEEDDLDLCDDWVYEDEPTFEVEIKDVEDNLYVDIEYPCEAELEEEVELVEKTTLDFFRKYGLVPMEGSQFHTGMQLRFDYPTTGKILFSLTDKNELVKELNNLKEVA